jgi:hypothetical protein
MKNDSGAIDFNAVLLLFFAAALISGGVLFASTGITYFQTSSNNLNKKEEADKFLDIIVEELQPLKFYQFDDKNNALINELCSKYENYMLEIIDVSSGYHLNFLSDIDFSDNNLTRLIFKDNSGAAFLSWLKTNGLSTDKNVWREFIKDEAWEVCVSYGWLHKTGTASYAYRNICESFGLSEIDKLFPLINDFPRMNINMVDPQMLYPLILRSSFNIERAKERADALANRLQSGPVLQGDISTILRIPLNHPLMGYLGTKTAFWRITYSMSPSLGVEAIIAAIQKKDGAIQEIEAYKLISRSFIDG